MASIRRNRRSRVRSTRGLTGAQMEILLHGCVMLWHEQPGFESHAERLAGWRKHGRELLAASHPGSRPAAFYEFDLQESRVSWRWYDQIAVLLRHELIDQAEAVTIESDHPRLKLDAPSEHYFADSTEGLKRIFCSDGHGLRCHLREMELAVAWHKWRNRPAMVEIFERRSENRAGSTAGRPEMKSHDVLTDRDPDLEAYIALRRQRFPHRHAASILGWQPEHADAVRKRAEYRRAQNRTPLYLGFGRTQFGGRESIYFPPFSENAFSGLRLVSDMKTQDLLAQLQEAQIKLGKTEADAAAARVSRDHAQTVLEERRAELARDLEDSVLSERKANAELPRLLRAAETEVAKANETLVAYIGDGSKKRPGALIRQRDAVEGIEAQLGEMKHEMFIAAFSEPLKKLESSFDAFLKASLEAHHVAGLYEHELFDELFAQDRFEIRTRKINLIFNALGLHAFWNRSYTDAPVFRPPEVHPLPFLIAPVARNRHPLEMQVGQHRVLLSELNDKHCVVIGEECEAQREIDRIRESRRTIEGFKPLEPTDARKIAELSQLVETKNAELKLIQTGRRKIIDLIARLEKEHQQARSAAAAA